MNLYTITIFLITYLICSVNPAIIICKKKTGEDIRKLGSGNAGSANAMRVLGKPLGTIVVILDIVKVLVAFFICVKVSNIFKEDIGKTLKSVFIVATVIGHCFPIYYKFRGGKGVIVGITASLILDKKITFICIIVGLVIILISKTVAMGTLSGLGLYLLMIIIMATEYTIPVLISSVIVMFKHRMNIQRMLAKQETKLW